MNVISFIINIFIGIWLVPYYILHLGVSAYGLIPIAMIFTEYVSIFTISINGSVARFLTIAIQKNNWLEANKIFNTSFAILLGVIALLIPLLIFFLFDLTHYVEIPSALIEETFYLFAFTFGGFFLSLIGGVFSTSLYANNRIDLIKIIDITRIASRILTIIILFKTIEPSLLIVGIANFLAAFFSFVLCVWFSRRLTPEIKLNVSYFDKTIVKKIGSMGGWLIVNKLGALLFLKIDLLIINRLIGPGEAGKYAAIQQWSILINTVAAVISSVFGPMILISYAKDKIEDVIKFGKYGVKYISILIGLISGIVAGFSTPLLKVWLGPEYVAYSFLLILMIVHLPMNLGITPLFSIFGAKNKVKIPGLVTLSMGLLNLVLAIFFVKNTNLGVLGVALSSAIVLTFKNSLFTPWYAARIMDIKSIHFLIPLFYGLGTILLSFVITWLGIQLFSNHNWFSLLFTGAITTLVCIAILWFTLFTDEDKKLILSYIPKKNNNEIKFTPKN